MSSSRFLSRWLPALLAGVATLAPAIALSQAADKFPSSPVTIIVPFPAGGSTDFVARTVGRSLADIWKVPVVVENKVGAGGNIGADFVARSPANGLTILMGAVSTVTNPSLYKTAPYIPRVLVPIGVGVDSHLVTIARNDLPARDIAGMIALSATKPGGLNAASAGAGTLSHLGLELLGAEHKARINHIPYRGSAPALTDVAGGQVDIMIDTITSATPMITAGKVKALAVHSPQRNPALPGVPSYAEQGIAGMSFSAWNIFMVPAGTPADRVATLNEAMAAVVRDPAVVKSFAERGLDVIVQTPAASIESLRNDALRWEKVIKDKNVTL